MPDGNDQEISVSFIVGLVTKVNESGDMRKFVNSLQIVVNTGILDEFSQEYGEDASDLIPCLVEHEIFEAWIAVKYGVGGGMGREMRHMLARRREAYIAVKQGLGEKWFEYQMYVNPDEKDEYLSALAYAKHRSNGS